MGNILGLVLGLYLSTIGSTNSWEGVAQKVDFFNVEPYNKVMYLDVDANVFELPSAKSDRISRLSMGDKITVVGKCNDNWYQVDCDGVSYINSCYLVENPVNTNIEVSTYVDSSIEESNFISDISSGALLPSYISVEGNVSDDFVNTVLDYWEYIPERVKAHFILDNSQLIITDSDLSKISKSHSTILGVTVFDRKKNNCKIYIHSSDRAKTTILHEIGHYVDAKLGSICKRGLDDIYDNELKKFRAIDDTADANVATVHEYFAEATYMYLLYPDKLKKSCPDTFDYVQFFIRKMDSYVK